MITPYVTRLIPKTFEWFYITQDIELIFVYFCFTGDNIVDVEQTTVWRGDVAKRQVAVFAIKYCKQRFSRETKNKNKKQHEIIYFL